ncbi:MAG: response regulator [Cyanobacteriota bacterium]|nr:response regulator [Cyanobacteriota bacterium]
MKILAIANDELTARTLATVLSSQHYAVEIAENGRMAWELIEIFPYDLIVMEALLPQLDGISLCKKIRDRGHAMPILVLAEQNSSRDRVIGLDAGADDYLVKPFDPQELLARVRALLRRGGAATQPILTWGNLSLDPSTCDVTYESTPVLLTPKEYALLELFLRNRRRVFSCGAILEHLWAFDDIPGEYAVRTHIKELRHKLKAAGVPVDAIETVYGIGYRLKQETNISAEQPQPASSAEHPQAIASVANVWHRFKAKIHSSVEVLDRAATASLQETLSQDLRHQAEWEAHTLAGSLGTFGLMQGSQLARQIGRGLQAGETGKPETSRLQEWVAALRHELARAPENLAAAVGVAPEKRSVLLVVDRDRALTEQLVREAEVWGMCGVGVASLAAARAAIEECRPKAILLDPAVSSTDEESFKFLAEVHRFRPEVPVLVLTARESLTDRLQVVRSGGSAFLAKPMSATGILKAVDRVLHQGDPLAAKIAIVDDDPETLAGLRHLLEPWGLNVVSLADPKRFWETLEATMPDLLLLAAEMSHLSGIELCQVLRNDARWDSLPVIFLARDRDAVAIERMFAAGGDDFVSKPIVGPEPIARIISRLERSRRARRLRDRSSHLCSLFHCPLQS